MKYNLYKRFFFLLFFIIAGCSGSGDYPQMQKWQLIYQNDFDGNPVSASIGNLLNVMKKESPIRVSWGGTEEDGSSWIEFAEPVFTTVMKDTVNENQELPWKKLKSLFSPHY